MLKISSKINKLLITVEKNTHINFLKEDFRKIGINFITTGIIALFVNHTTYPTSWLWISSGWLIMIGGLAMFFGLKKGHNHG